MRKNLHIWLIISVLMKLIQLRYDIDMYNLHTIFVKFLENCKEYSANLCGKIRERIAY